MSLKALQDYTFVSKYARYNEELKRRETWDEAVGRVKDMHLQKYPQKDIREDIEWAFDRVKEKRVLGSQRALQFGGKPVLKKNARLYNCTVSYCDRLRFFQESFWLLLCGCGVGFSVQKHHVAKLPKFVERKGQTKVYVIPDSIEGWADSLGVLLSSYFGSGDFTEYAGYDVEFNYGLIRPEGSKLGSSSGKAPGPVPLQRALQKITELLNKCLENGLQELRSIDAYDIIMHASDAVLSGGVRRSATICLFSPDDQLMATAKTGNWFNENPQRGRSNNSALLIRGETTYEQFLALMESVKEYGEPGFVWSDSTELMVNPCQPNWAKVITPQGMRQFKDIDAGDEIWSKEGWTTVKKKWSTGINKVYKYTTTAGVFYGTKDHKIVSHGEKIKAVDANDIDIIAGPKRDDLALDIQSVMDGLVAGDGSVHKASGDLIFLCIGKDDQDYFSDEVKTLIKRHRPGIREFAYEIKTTLEAEDICHTYDRQIPNKYLYSTPSVTTSFLRGLYSANGSIVRGRVTLKSSSFKVIEDVQSMLSSIGIKSYYTTNKAKKVAFRNGEYDCKISYDLNITSDRDKFQSLIGFIQEYKNVKLNGVIESTSKGHPKNNYDIVSIELISEEETFDITVNNSSHTYWTQGCNVSNCVEIGMWPVCSVTGESGWSFCNLCEINGKKVKTEEDFAIAAKAAAIIGTLQAGYDEFDYLGEVTSRIVRKEALLGVSITGMMDSPEILFDPKLQRKMAKMILKVNDIIAAKIGVNQCARATCVKPAGTTSCILGTASGIHAHHARRYVRRSQANYLEAPCRHFKEVNPSAVEKSVWSANGTDEVIAFCVEVPKGAKIKNDLDAITLLEHVKLTQQNWVSAGTREEACTQPWLKHNVSNTITVMDGEWEEVAKFIFKNRRHFAGISLLPQSGDKDYPQAPFTAIYTPTELAKMYGDGMPMASGLVVDGLYAFGDNLWAACDEAIGVTDLEEPFVDIEQATASEVFEHERKMLTWHKKKDWCRRVQQFADRYLEGDNRQATYLMKDVHNWKLWCDLQREYKNVDYTLLYENEDNTTLEQTIACGDGKCDLSYA